MKDKSSLKFKNTALAIIIAIVFLPSCKINPDSSRKNAEQNGRVYKLRLNPDPNTKYYYTIGDESNLIFEVNDKKVENATKTNVDVYYSIKKDSTGNFLVSMDYDKINVYIKNGDDKSEMDAANAQNSINPAEKMLGMVKEAKLVAVVNSLGEVKSVTGYNEMASKILAGFAPGDTYGRNLAESRLKKLIDQGVIRNNIENLFKVFPDSSVHVGDRWKLSTRENNDVGLRVEYFYTLKDIQGNHAFIYSESKITSDSSVSNLMGYDVTASLSGEGEGEYEVDLKSSMLIKGKSSSKINGTIEMIGREIPMSIETKFQIDGKK